MRHLSQRVGLVHELRQCVCAEICIDDRRYGLGIDQVNRLEHLVVAHIHALADSASHTHQAYAELVVELFAYCTHTAVAEVVNVIDLRLRVDKLNQIFDNLDNVLARQHPDIHGRVKSEFLVYAETPHLTQVITLL